SEGTPENVVAATPHRERGVECPFDVILLTGRSAERRQHRVAGELLERAACVLDLGRHGLVVTFEQRARSLRILLAELRRPYEIDEEHGRQLPLGHRRRRRRRRGHHCGLRSSRRPRLDVERWIVSQDGLLEVLKRATRLEPELLDKRAPGTLVGRERLGLATGSIER